MRIQRLPRLAVLLLLLSTAACGARIGTGGPRNENRLTAEDLGRSTAQNAYEAIEQLRPEWFRSRGPTSVTDPTPTLPNVIMHGQRVGDVEYLRRVQLVDVAELRFWNPGEAATRFGMGHPRGVIEVIIKS